MVVTTVHTQLVNSYNYVKREHADIKLSREFDWKLNSIQLDIHELDFTQSFMILMVINLIFAKDNALCN